MKNKLKRKRGIEGIKEKYGYIFVAPWLFGILVFVLEPLATSLYFAFTEAKVVGGGVDTSFAGLKWIKFLLIEDADYIDLSLSSLGTLLTQLPIILSLSMVLAIVLNQKFKGRLLARCVFFLPVIISSGPVLSVLSSFTMSEELASSFGGSDVTSATSAYMQVIDFQDILYRLNLPDSINNLMSNYLSDTFNLVWSCGIQILLFVAGLQSISPQLYEVSKVEGASKWEEFWYITIPMMGRTILLVAFYTMIDLFVEKSALVSKAIELIRKQVYDKASAMLWMYFLLAGIAMGILMLVYKKLCLKRWES